MADIGKNLGVQGFNFVRYVHGLKRFCVGNDKSLAQGCHLVLRCINAIRSNLIKKHIANVYLNLSLKQSASLCYTVMYYR